MSDTSGYNQQRLNRIARRNPGVRCVLDALNKLNRDALNHDISENAQSALLDLRAAMTFFHKAAADDLDRSLETIRAYRPNMLAPPFQNGDCDDEKAEIQSEES